MLVSSEVNTNSGFATFNTALPIWAVQFTRLSPATRLIMDSVTIVLPVDSFASLYFLAVSGGPSNLTNARIDLPTSWAPLMDPALDCISMFNVSRSEDDGTVIYFMWSDLKEILHSIE